MDELDPLRLDRALRETAGRARAWGRRLRRGAGLDEAPFEATRWAIGKSTFQAVSEMRQDDPLRIPLRRWIYRLSEVRINQAVLMRISFELRHQPRAVEGAESSQPTLAEVLAFALADSSARRPHWLAAFGRHAAPLATLVRSLWERRAEIARRMGLDSADSLAAPVAGLAERAERWLAETDDAFTALECRTLPILVERALGLPGASDGWPRHLLLRTLTELVGQPELFRSLDLDLGDLPPPVGPASFLRGLRRLGATWVRAAAPRDQPFVVAHDAYALRDRTEGALFAGLPLNPEFARRQLGIARDRMSDFQRALAAVVLVETRLAALRTLLAERALQGERAYKDEFARLTERGLRVPLPGELAGAFIRTDVDEGQRFSGLFLAARQAAALTDAHDSDWFRNPRATDQLRSEAALSPEITAEPQALDQGEALLLARLTRAL